MRRKRNRRLFRHLAEWIYHQPKLGRRLRQDADVRESLKELYPGQNPEHLAEAYQIRSLEKQLKTAALLLPILVLLAALDIWSMRNAAAVSLPRREAGKGSYQVELNAETASGSAEKMTVLVEEQKYDSQQTQELFDRAEEELTGEYLGQNVSPDRIEYPLFLPDQVQDGLVDVEWSFDHYNVLDTDGSIRKEETVPEGTVVNVTASMSYRGEEAQVTYPVRVYPPAEDAEEKLRSDLDEALSQADAESEESADMMLPQEAEIGHVTWTRLPQHYALKTGFLLLVLLLFLSYENRQNLKRKRKEREEQLLLDYPVLVSKLSLLFGAGMTLSGAWNRIIRDARKAEEEQKERQEKGRHFLQKKEDRRYSMEEMQVTARAIADGESEIEAFRKFGERCGLRQYRKLSSLLTQNLKLGSSQIGRLLEQEAAEAFEQRKALARQRGEEAGTRLLGPMMAYLIVVMMIVMVPGFLSFLSI